MNTMLALQTNEVRPNPEMFNPFTATLPHSEVSDKYRFISTSEFIQDVASMGYSLVNTSGPRKGLGMHSMTFSHANMPKLDGLELRLLATNSHDGTSAFRLYIQALVQVCSNGLVAWQTDASTATRVIHRGYAIDKVATAIDAVVGRINGVVSTVDLMQKTNVTPELGAAFLTAASGLRDAKPYRIIDLQAIRHREQGENNAWNIFNRVQEAIIRGGYTTQNKYIGGDGVERIGVGAKARELKAVRERVAVNTKLWQLAVENLLNQKA